MSASPRRRRWVFTATTCLLLASCSSTTPDVPPPFAIYTPVGEDAPEAEIGGTLTLSDGCLTVNGFPLSLPDDAEWDADSGVLSVDGNTYATGEVVAWGGGYSAATPDDLPASCPPGELAKVYAFD